AKGIWDTGTFIGAPGAYTRSNCGMNKLVAWSGASISNTTTGCNSYTQTSVSGTNWTYFKDGSGNVVAGLNPNGVNLGDVMIQMDDMAAVPQDGLNLYYLPRYFNFESTLFDGIAMPFPSAVSIRLYFEGAELSSYNTDKGSAETMNDLSISHYSGGTEDCNILNNDDYDGTNVEFLTASANMYGVNSFSLQFDVNHFSEMGASGTDNGAIGLPVELTYFQAEKKGNTALLSWETASEENNLGFHIERSLDGQRFETISWIKGAGTAAEVQNYNFVDERPMTGINYYRLVQEDIDGTTSPSDIRKVEFGKKMSISLFPNPSKNGQGITLQIDADKQGTTSINILDITGKQISSTSLELEAGMNNTTLETQDLAEGIYFLRLMNNGAIQTL
ncbi:MAG: T9SS type A sorting domain-containing protein, partial [Saprospiraceae bacterium]